MGTRKGRIDRAKMRSPGRPPVLHRAERRPFWQAIANGCSSEEAAHIAGVSQPVGTRWFRECGGMPPSHLSPSSPLATGRYLSLAEREQIALLRVHDRGVREIARQLERAASTISRELRRNACTRSGGLDYRAYHRSVACRSCGATSQACQTGDPRCTTALCPRSPGWQGCYASGEVHRWSCRSLEGAAPRTKAASTVVARVEPGTDRSPLADRLPGRFCNAHQPRSDLPVAVHPRARRPSA
jgi:Helix-turn-helix domain